jgi:hypothetical protein
MAIQSLFGPSPAEIQELRRQQEEKEILASGGEFGAFAPLYQAGLRFGSAGRQAMAPLMGAQDPMLQKATAIQGVLAKYQDQDPSDPLVLTQIGRELMTVDPDAGFKAIAMARELTPKTESVIGKVNPSDFTPESLQAFIEAGAKDYSLLRETPSKAKGNSVNVDLRGVISEAYAKTEGKEKATAWAESGKTYKLSVPLLAELETANKVAQNAYFGFGAKGKIGLSKALNAIGIPISDRAQDSEFLDAMSSKLVQRIAKNFPGSQAIKELEQLIKSKPNLEQESGTFMRLLNNVTNEFKAEVLAYEKLAAMPEAKRYEQDFNVVTGQIYKKITRYQDLESKVRNKTASAKEASEALSIKRELGL